MRIVLKLFLLCFLLLAAAAMNFFFWAKKSNLSQQEYALIFKYDSLSYTADTTADSLLTVATYNIGYLSGLTNNTENKESQAFFDQNRQTVARAFADTLPDLIGLQEIDFDADRSYNQDQLATLARQWQYGYAARAVNWDKRYVPFPYWPIAVHFGKVVSGQAVLSRYAIQTHKYMELQRPQNAFWYDAFYIARLAQVVTTKINGRPVALINVHLEAFDAATRRKQTLVLRELARSYARDYAVIVTGDFNSSLQEETLHPAIQLMLQDSTFVSAVPQQTLRQPAHFTYPSHKPQYCIDYVFAEKAEFDIVRSKVLTQAGTASDHLPVVATLKWKNK